MAGQQRCNEKARSREMDSERRTGTGSPTEMKKEAAETRRRSRTETNKGGWEQDADVKKTCNWQHDREEGKKNRGRDLDRESWAKAKRKAAKTKKEAMNKRQRGRNETTRIGSWERK